MANTHNREISVRQLMLARFCTHSALTTTDLRQRADAMRIDSRKHKRLVKDVARRLLKDDQRKAAAQAQGQVATRTLAEQKSIIRKARKIAEARLAGLAEGDQVQMAVQQRWYDSETGWTILFQPNRVETLTDEEGDYVRVLGWTDKHYVRFWQMEMARMFGLLQFIQEKGEMRIQMVLESLLKDQTLWDEWLDSPEVALEMLKEVQAVIRRLEDALVSDRVPPRTAGKHCNGCPVKKVCRQGQKFLARQHAPATTDKTAASVHKLPGHRKDNKPLRKAA
jgi:hypothetical protein